MRKVLLSLIALFCFFAFTGLSEAQVAQQISLEQMQRDLAKINRSIDETQEKIREVRDARFLPDIYFALAEFLVEKSRYMYAIKIAQNSGTPIDELDFTAEKRPKFRAIEIYDIIIDKFPKLEERDKAIFFKGHELRELGRLEDMVNTYAQLTREYPKSPFWTESQIIIGDYFFEEKKEIELALEMFQKILKRPKGPFTPLAYYKIGWCYINLTKFEKALFAFEKVLTEVEGINLQELPEQYKKTDVRRDALLAMVWPYSEVEKSRLKKFGTWRSNPLTYFRKLSPNRISYTKVLTRLGRRLTLKKRYIETTQVYYELLRLISNVEERLEIIERLYISMKNTQNKWPVRGFASEIAKTIAELKSNVDIKKAVRQKAFKDFEIFARDIATREQKRAKKTKRKEDWEWAIRDYKAYLWAFPKSKKNLIIRLNLAESYFNAGELIEAAKAYEKLTGMVKSARTRKSLFDSSIQAYISSLRNQEGLSRLELVEIRYGLRQVGKKYIALYPNEKSVPGIRFNIGQTYYDERNFNRAVKEFKEYISNHPTHRNVNIAANLILDAFNQKEDFKGIIREGRSLLANKRIKDRQLRIQISQIVEQAEMKAVQKKAGEFGTAEYATNLLKLARKFKGSSLGDKALYEAFISFRSKRDPRAYKSGEQLLLQHGKSKYAEEVVSAMGQMALVTADFRRAAIYFELFHEKYPNKKDSKSLLRNAATMRELMGDYKIAARDYAKLNNYRDAARMDFVAGDWSALRRSAPKVGGLEAAYYEGLATYRLRGFSAAKGALEKTVRHNATRYEEQEKAAHALYLLAAGAMERYKRIQMRSGNENKAVTQKANMLKDLDKKLRKVIEYGNGRWTIAALYGLGQANKEFGEFIKKAPVPKGLNGAQKKQFKQAINQQASQYLKTGIKFFRQCIGSAEKFEVFTQFVKGCQSAGKVKVDEANEARIFGRAREKAPKGAKSLRNQLYDKPGDRALLTQLAQVYIKAKDFFMAELIINRALELAGGNDAQFTAQIGVIHMYKNDLQGAKEWFDKALKLNTFQPLALWGKAALYHKFNFKRKLSKTKMRAQKAGQPRGILHPMINRAL